MAWFRNARPSLRPEPAALSLQRLNNKGGFQDGAGGKYSPLPKGHGCDHTNQSRVAGWENGLRCP